MIANKRTAMTTPSKIIITQQLTERLRNLQHKFDSLAVSPAFFSVVSSVYVAVVATVDGVYARVVDTTGVVQVLGLVGTKLFE